jgi:hypothetical protein
MQGLAAVAEARGESRRAARLVGAAEALLESAGIPIYAQVDRELLQRVADAARERLGGAGMDRGTGGGTRDVLRGGRGVRARWGRRSACGEDQDICIRVTGRTTLIRAIIYPRSSAVWDVRRLPSAARTGEKNEREEDGDPQGDRVREVVAEGEGVALRQVEDEVRHRVGEVRDERDLHEAPFEQHGRQHQEHAQSEVQRAHVPHEVLVVGA